MHRFMALTGNRGFFCHFAILLFLAMLLCPQAAYPASPSRTKGMPRSSSSLRPSWSFRAEVVMVT